MARTAIAFDPDQLAAAQQILGTTGKQDTVSAALLFVIQQHALEEELAFAAEGGYAELRDPEFRARAWRE